MALNNLNMVFGDQKSPSTLTKENVAILLKAIADESCDVVLGGYIQITGGCTESEKVTLENKGLHVVNTTIVTDTYRIYAENNAITEDSETVIKAYNIQIENLVLEISNVTVNSSTVASSVIQGRIRLEGNKLIVAPADENASWTARVTISSHPTWSTSNIQTCTVNVTAIAAEEIVIIGPDQVPYTGNALYEAEILPANNTKYEPVITYHAASGAMTGQSYLATEQVDEDTITATADFYGTSLVGTKTIKIGNSVLNNDTLNPEVFAIVKEVLGLSNAIESLTSIDMQEINNEQIRLIWDKLRDLPEVSFDEFQYCTGVSTLTSTDTKMINLKSVKFPPSLKNIEGSVLTLNGALISDFDFADCTNTSIKLYGNVFMGSTVKTIDLNNVTNVYFGGITEPIAYGLCYNCNQLTSINWRAIYNWNETGRYSALSGGHFQNCSKLETVYTNGFAQYSINGGIFYNCSALRGIFTQDDTVMKDFAARLTNTSLTNQFYNCQLFELDSLNPDLTIIADNAFYNCVNLIADQELPYVQTLGNAFNGATGAFASKTLNLGASSSALTVILPTTIITPNHVDTLILGHRYATTLSKSTPDSFTANYSNINNLDISAMTRLTSVYYSMLCGFRNATITFNTTQVPALNGFDDAVQFTGTIKVPASLLSAWKSADNWNQIASHIVAA